MVTGPHFPIAGFASQSAGAWIPSVSLLLDSLVRMDGKRVMLFTRDPPPPRARET